MKEMTKDFDDLDALGYFNVNITFKSCATNQPTTAVIKTLFANNP